MLEVQKVGDLVNTMEQIPHTNITKGEMFSLPTLDKTTLTKLMSRKP